MSVRVLILNYEYPPLGGGAANALYHIIHEFAGLGDISADLVTSSHNGRAEIIPAAEGINLHKLAVKKKSIHYWTERELVSYAWKALKYARTILAAGRHDLCHAFSAIPCGYMGRRLRPHLPYIVSLRGSDVPGFNRRTAGLDGFFKPVFRRVLEDAEAVQANSDGLRQLAYKTSPNTPIEVIHNGVDCRRFEPAGQLGLSGTNRLITVARLIERKGISDLISALPLVKAELGRVELTVVGEGKLEEELKKLAVAKGVDSCIRWAGYVDHQALPDLYRLADLFVLPSHYEGMSNALLEAMACGLPVVVTETGGTAELVDGNGLIVRAGDERSIAQGITDVLVNNDTWSNYSKKSRQTATTFSWASVAGRYAEVYRKAVGAKANVGSGL